MEAIHLPCAPDMVGVLSWGRKDENLGVGAREWVDGRREGVGGRDESLSPYKDGEYQNASPLAVKLAYSLGAMQAARLDYPYPY